MKKQYLFLSVAALFALVACSSNEPANEGEVNPLSLHDANAKFVVSGYGEDALGNKEYFPLATYHHKDNGEAPYVEMSEFLNVINNIFHNSIDYSTMTPTRLTQYDNYILKISDHLYGVYSEEVLGATIDTKENIFRINRFDYLSVSADMFNGGLRNDPTSCNGGRNASLVHGSGRSRYVGEFTAEVYDLDDYHMDIVEKDNKVYMPEQLLSNIFLRSNGVDFVYNGNDFFISTYVGANSTFPHMLASCRSSKNTFEFGGTLFSKEAPKGNEEYRYVGKVSNETYNIFTLDKEGHGYSFNASSPDETEVSNPLYKLDWEKNNGDIYLKLYGKDGNGGFQPNSTSMRISSNETFYNKKSRSKALAEFNYNLLRFQIDNFYGLKKELNEKHPFTDFDSFTIQNGLKEKLLSEDTRRYDEGLSEFLMGYLDDGHVTYNGRSLFSGIEETTASDLSQRYIGPRRSGLFTKLSEYQGLRKEALGEGVEAQGLFMEGNTAVVRFDEFAHPLPALTNPGSVIDDMDISTLMKASSPYGFLKAFAEIKKHSEIKNVVIDLTCNGGGAVLTLPFLAAYFAKDPILCIKDNQAGVVREYHYDVDLNLDGIYGGEEDYLGDKYHMYVLTSDFSFSCGSALPTMAKIANVDIIGIPCGGGACNVAGYTDACGSLYNLSAPQQIGYLNADGDFVNDDAGIPVTHQLAKDSWYDLAKLNAAIAGFQA